MSDRYVKLMVDGEHYRRRWVDTQTGESISRREYMKRVEGETPEQKAYRRYQTGAARPGVTVRNIEKKKEVTRVRETPAGEELEEKTMISEPRERRGYLQLQGEYSFYHPEFKTVATAVGYSTAQRDKRNYRIAQAQAIEHAVAQLDGYEWVFDGVEWEQWLTW